MGHFIPLLNDYKQEFVLKRLLQTVFGGPKLLIGYDAPLYVYIAQILLWIFPWLLGGILTMVLQFSNYRREINDYFLMCCCTYGACISCFVVIVQMISYILQGKQKDISSVISKKNHAFLADEDIIDFQNCCGKETIRFIIPHKIFKVNIIVHALVSGVMCAIGLWYLLPDTIGNLFDDSVASTVLIYLFGWYTLSVAQYSLTVSAPPEPAVFRTMDMFELSSLYRPFYVLVCMAFHAMHVHWDFTSFRLVNQILHIVFICLPLMWIFGMLPPIEALFLWIGEQVNIFLFGASPVATNVRLVLWLTGSMCVFLGAYFLPTCFGTVMLSSIMGYILSVGLPLLLFNVVQTFHIGNRVSSCEGNDRAQLISSDIKSKYHLSHSCAYVTILYHGVMCLITAGLTAASSLNNGHLDRNLFGWIVVGLCVVERCCRDLQSVFLFFGTIRNCFYPHNCQDKTPSSINAKLTLSYFGIFRRVVVNWMAPLAMVMYLSISVSQPDVMTQSATRGLSTNQAIWMTFGIVRSYRWAWQNTCSALLEMSTVHLFTVFVNVESTINLPSFLLLCGLVQDRVFNFFNKLAFFVMITISFCNDEKLRHCPLPHTIFLIVFFSPFILAIIVVAATLSTPILPIFTLPIIFIGYPRPRRFWPEPVGSSANVCPDAIFYKQVFIELARSFSDGFASGHFGEAAAGNHYLVRYQDRLMWVMVLERGHAFCTLSIKGLEFQETSCHTAEASHLDEIFDAAFYGEAMQSPIVFNKYLMHSLRPLGCCNLKTYSDARNVLTGLIECSTAVETSVNFFIHSLVWIVLHHVNKSFICGLGGQIGKQSENALAPAVMGEKADHLSRTNYLNNTSVVDFSLNQSPKSITPQILDAVQSSGSAFLPPVNVGASSMFHVKSKGGKIHSVTATDVQLSDDEQLSLGSFSGSLLSDEGSVSRRQTRPLHQAFVSSSVDTVEKLHVEGDSFLNNLNLGAPAVDVSIPQLPCYGNTISSLSHSCTSNCASGIYKPVTILAHPSSFKCCHSTCLSLPNNWVELPIQHSNLTCHLNRFPVEWYRHVLTLLDWTSTGLPAEKVAADVGQDDVLMSCYSTLIIACYTAFNITDNLSGARLLYKSYLGDVPCNAMFDWLSEDKELMQLVMKAFRYGFKLMLDSLIFGEIGNSNLEQCLREMDTDWYVGLEKEREWTSAVLESKPKLFSLGHNDQGIYTSRVLSLQELPISVGQVNSEVVYGQWANLSLELLYMTNDDEERYSIQAHPTILRNLTVQAADPPLGYPIFSSPPISIPLL